MTVFFLTFNLLLGELRTQTFDNNRIVLTDKRLKVRKKVCVNVQGKHNNSSAPFDSGNLNNGVEFVNYSLNNIQMNTHQWENVFNIRFWFFWKTFHFFYITVPYVGTYCFTALWLFSRKLADHLQILFVDLHYAPIY